jgi:hypothetical protein
MLVKHKALAATSHGVAFGSVITAVLDRFTPEQWNAIGILGGLTISGLTALASLHYQRKDDRRKSQGLPEK